LPMGNRAWHLISIFIALLLLALPVWYTWFIYTNDRREMWSWGHQFVATFFSVGIAFAIGIWLYALQQRWDAAGKRKQLRAALIITIFDIRDLLKDENIKTVPLPDGSTEKVLLTFLQPTIFEEAMRSGLFGASETFALSRTAALIQLYNSKNQRLLETYSALETRSSEGEVDDATVEHLRGQIYAVQDDVQQIVTGCENIMKSWSFKQLNEALNAGTEHDREDIDPKVELLIEQFQLRVTPPGYKAGVYTKLWEIEDNIKAGNQGATHTLIDDLIKEINDIPKTRITPEEEQALIKTANDLREELAGDQGDTPSA
jgi:hypothetical protein